MRKLKKLEKILRALGYNCGVVEDADGPELRLYLDNYMAYIVYDTGSYYTDRGAILATTADNEKICKAIKRWLIDEGLWSKLESIKAEVSSLGFETFMREQSFAIWYNDLLIGRYGLNHVFSREEAFYEDLPGEMRGKLMAIFKRIDQEELARLERRDRRKKE